MELSDRPSLAECEAVYKGVQGNPTGLRDLAADLVARVRRTQDDEALVVALHALGWAEYEAMRDGTAKRVLDEAVRLAGRRGLDARLGELLVSRAAVHQELGLVAPAFRDLGRAAALLPVERRAVLVFQQAVIDQNAARLGAARTRYERLLDDPLTPVDVQAKSANNLADLTVAQGRPHDALPLVDRAIALSDEVGPVYAAYFWQTWAKVNVQAGRYAEGISAFGAARARFEQAGMPLGEHLTEYADVLAELRLLPEALSAAREGAAQLAASGARLLAAEALLRVARLELVTGSTVSAGLDAHEAAAELARQRRPAWAARARLVEQLSGETDERPSDLRRDASTLERAGLLGDAVEAHLAAGRAFARAGDRSRALASLGRASSLSGNAPLLVRLRGRVAFTEQALLRGLPPREVAAACAAGLSDLAAHRAALPSAELRALASGHGVELARTGLRALLPVATPSQLLHWLERMRAAAVGRVVDDAPTEEGQHEQLRALYAEADRLRSVIAREPVSDTDPALTRVTLAIAHEETRLRRVSWTGRDRGSVAAPIRATPLQRFLGTRVLAEYAEVDGELMAVVVTSRSVRVVHLGHLALVARAIDVVDFALRRLAAPGRATPVAAVLETARTALARLEEALVRPLGVPADAELVVAPVAVLRRVPWTALHGGPVSVTPSASLWCETRTTPARSGTTVLVAGPDLDGGRSEVDRLASLHPGALVLRAPARARAVVSALDGAGLVHLSCHGRLRSDSPVFSALQMDDGPLTLHEMLSGARQAPDRVVLAACESGADAAYPGDEPLGFVASLMAGGARAVLASSVLVPDRAAVELMVGLHRHLLAGSSMAEALHRSRRDAARLRVDDDPRSAAAAFVADCAFSAYGAG